MRSFVPLASTVTACCTLAAVLSCPVMPAGANAAAVSSIQRSAESYVLYAAIFAPRSDILQTFAQILCIHFLDVGVRDFIRDADCDF